MVTDGLAPATSQPPIQGGSATPAGDGRDTNNFLTSMVYHMDKMGNPDIFAKPGTVEGIRRIDEIHVVVARFF